MCSCGDITGGAGGGGGSDGGRAMIYRGDKKASPLPIRALPIRAQPIERWSVQSGLSMSDSL